MTSPKVGYIVLEVCTMYVLSSAINLMQWTYIASEHTLEKLKILTHMKSFFLWFLNGNEMTIGHGR